MEEGQNFILECFWPNEDLTFKLFDWKQDVDVEVFMYDAGVHYNNGRSGQDPQFQGRVSHFPEALKHGNASIQIHSAKVKDNGTYICYFPQEDVKRSTKIEVKVGECPSTLDSFLVTFSCWNVLVCASGEHLLLLQKDLSLTGNVAWPLEVA